jgi:hypothetical protein
VTLGFTPGRTCPISLSKKILPETQSEYGSLEGGNRHTCPHQQILVQLRCHTEPALISALRALLQHESGIDPQSVRVPHSISLAVRPSPPLPDPDRRYGAVPMPRVRRTQSVDWGVARNSGQLFFRSPLWAAFPLGSS